jgi:D-alanyl-lipoteichoic acid acyltransferase DltB (MBOAT superfamily)
MFNIDIHKLLHQFTYQEDQPLIFNSGFFLFLFLLFLTAYNLLSKTDRPKILFVTLFSLYFYYKSSGVYFILLIAITFIDFYLAKWIYLTNVYWKRYSLMILSLVTNLGMLGYYKYTNFFHEIFSAFAEINFQPLDIFLPVGISFFTFQSLSYTLDVYRKKLKPASSLLDYAFFVSFFPQLVAGPIVRAADFLPQIHQPTFVTKQMLGRGLFLICTGLFKKAVISDYISINFVDRIFDAPTLYTGFENMMAVYGYALQIYCDFSGYSDMAIGIALLLGFHFLDNFNSPYQSKSITEFWRRWHISLSTWLKDYLYISLGGNRKGKWRTYFNLIITMLLGGLWHGASVRFILWGGLHGFALAIEKALSSQAFFKLLKANKIFQYAGLVLTFNFVCFCWIFFRATSMETASDMINQIVFHFKPEVFSGFLFGYFPVVILLLIGYVLHFLPRNLEKFSEKTFIQMPGLAQAFALALIIFLVMQTKSSAIQPFIYFQF